MAWTDSQILESDEAQLHLMMRDYCRKTVDDIVQANFEGKKEKIIEKCRQFFPNLGEIKDSVSVGGRVMCNVGAEVVGRGHVCT